MPFKVEVIADNSGRWCGNGLVFATRQEGEQYARDLANGGCSCVTGALWTPQR
jgi:hypothetical protein